MRTEQSAQRTYLVTGVAGFIASKVAEMRLAEGLTASSSLAARMSRLA
jgi:nucleoside-diphosphate-sugar epimerase